MQPHVTQHELFIRAAMEGRRDHVYQAAMFDPLTAATLTLDQMVEMCDELIAAHGRVDDGGFLPDLDAKKTLVSGSGKTFPSVDARELRLKWCEERNKALLDYIKTWHVIGPFPAGEGNRQGLDLPTDVERDFARRGDGTVDLKATYSLADPPARWKTATANQRGFVDLCVAVGPVEWAVAYAYAAVESSVTREVILRLGSDDGIKVWLNGTVVHHHETGRGYRPDSDRAVATLKAGINHLLVKIDNYTAGWGFGLAVPGS